MTTNLRGRDALICMLQTRRPAWSKSERRWIKDWLLPLGVEPDDFGNLILRIGDAPVLWSAHTDTVHTQGGRQLLALSAQDHIVLHPDETVSNCLGADDTTGCWLLREMILERRPGLYIFHRAEEIGGRGSAHIATRTPTLLDGIKWGVAFDRKGYTSVITHQCGRSASDKFASALADQLGGEFAPDPNGIFTDTANYTGLIPECTNVSVGYHKAHSINESQDLPFALSLLDSVLEISRDVSSWPVYRSPGEFDPDDWWSGEYRSHGKWSSRGNRDDLIQLIKDNPAEIADYLDGWGITAAELAQVVYERGGIVSSSLFA